MELEKNYVNLSRRKGTAVSQITLEEDRNVPDQKPDIFRVVHRQGEFHLDEIKGESGKVKVRGIYGYRILYIGEGPRRRPELLEGSIPVDETIFLSELEEGDMLDFRWKQEDLHASAIHSRKINIKCVLSLTVEAGREQPVPLVERPREEGDLCLRTCPVRLQQEVIHKKDTLRVREDLSLSPGRPNIQRILWKEARLQGAEARPDEGKLYLKGELIAFFLYESSEEDAQIQWMEQSIPFRSEVECDGCRTDLFGGTQVVLRKAEMELQPDYDGEPRVVRVDAVLELLMRYFEDRTCEVLCDAYSLTREIIPKQRECVWDYISQVSEPRVRVSGRLRLSDADPKPLQLLCAGAQLHGDYTEPTEQGLLIQGTVELWVLYASAEDSQPLACVTQDFPFEHTEELTGDSRDAACQLIPCLDQLTVSMTDARELEMKAVGKLQLLASRPRSLSLVEELEEGPLDQERLSALPGMVIHIVQPGESLWDISRAHATTCAAVAELNGLKEEEVRPGVKLLLVKDTAGKDTAS